MKKKISASLWSVAMVLVLICTNHSVADCITNPITVNAGIDKAVPNCYSMPSQMPVSLTGSFGGSATGCTWTTSGSGYFSPVNSANTNYYPSNTDAMSVTPITLTLTATGGGCSPLSDNMQLSFYLYTPNAYSGPDQTVCSNVAFVQLAGSSIASSYTWSTKGTGTGTFTPNNTSLNAKYIPSAQDITNGSVQITLRPSGDPCDFAQPMTVKFLKIGSSPTSPTICENASTTFATTVVAGYTGTVTYQWQVDKGIGYANATDLTNEYTGSSTATLTLKPNVATNLYNGYKYRAVVSACSTTYTSTAATLTVKSNTLTVTAPTDQSACVGGNAVFTASVNPNTVGVTYRWMTYNGTAFVNMSNSATVAGVTTPALTLSNITAGMQGNQYKLSATNGCAGTQLSVAKQLNLSNLIFTTQPQSSSICSNGSADFTVAVSGDVVTSYQWMVNDGSGFVNVNNDAVYSGAATPTLSINAAPAVMNNYLYQCLVKSSCSPAGKTSGSATLTVNNAAAIGNSPEEQTVCEGQAAMFSVTASGASSYIYSWQVNDGNGYISILDDATYANSNSSTLTVNTATAQDGFAYRAMVQSASGCTLAVYSTAAVLHVNSTALSISDSPVAVSSCEGSEVSFSVTAEGAVTAYQWQEDSGSGFVDLIADETYADVTSATLTIHAITTPMEGREYRVMVTTACNELSSSPALLTVFAAPVITTQPSDVTVWNGGGTSFYSEASGSLLSYQWQVKGISDVGFSDLSDGSIYTNTKGKTLTLTSTSATLDGTSYRCVITSDDCSGITLFTDEVTLSVEFLEVCMVTTEETSGKNVIVFEKPAHLSGVDSFLVYRLNGSGDYDLIGRLHKNQLSTFVDEEADPTVQSYGYQVTVLDANKNIYPLSSGASPHTIHLSVTQAAGNTLQLDWNSYDGNSSNTYNIYRGLTAAAMSPLATVSDDGMSYTDNTAPSGIVFYQIELMLSADCNPTARTSAFSSTKSNRVEAENMVTGINPSSARDGFQLYPNPASDVVVLNGLREVSMIITVYDLTGSAIQSIVSTSSSVTLAVNEWSKGMYLIEIQNEYGIERRFLVIE